jgi:5-methylcytosine-specific restriction endonuclease McrA
MSQEPTNKPIHNLELFEANLNQLADKELIEQLKQLFAREKRIGDAILLNLQEINARRLYASMGYSSLFEMLVHYFGLSATAAYQRTAALKLIQAVPEAQVALFKGETNLSNMAATQSFIRKVEADEKQPLSSAKKSEIFASVVGKTGKEAHAIFAELNPVASLPNNKEKVLTPKHTQLLMVVEQETLELLQEVKALLSHEIPDGNYNQIMRRMAQLSVEILQKKKGRSESKTKSDGKSKTFELRSESQCNRSRYIAKEIKRKIFHRANGRCEFVSHDGKRCESRHQLEIDHKVPWSQGGGSDENNLQVCCKVHNSFRTMETHGFWWKPSEEYYPS